MNEILQVQVRKMSIPSNSAAPQICGTSLPASFVVAIDMDVESSRLLEVSDEKVKNTMLLTITDDIHY